MEKLRSVLFFIFISVTMLFNTAYANPAKLSKTLHVSPKQVVHIHTKSTCLSSVITLNNPSNWYAQATLQITNNCSSAQKLNDTVVSFQSNSNNLSSMWGGVNSSANFTYKDNIASTVLNIQNDPLGIGKTLTLYFGINLTGNPFDLTSANNTLTVIPNTPAPSDGEIDVTVDPTGVVGVTSSSEVDITGPGLSQPYAIFNSSWNTPTVFKVTGLAYGTYTISALPISNSYLGAATPPTVTVSSSAPQSVNVSYTAAPPTGALQINLGASPINGIATSVNATLTDNTINQTQTVNVAWNGYTLIPNLPVGDNFTLTFPQVSNGVSYSNANPIDSPIMILQNRTTPVSVTYQPAQPQPSQSVVFNVSGLVSGVTASLNIVDGYGNQFSQTNLGNGQVSQALPVNDTFAVSASATGMSVNVSPSSFTLANGTMPPAINVQFSAVPPPASGSHFLAYADTGMQSSNNGLVPPKGANMTEAFILYNPTSKKAELWAITEGDNISKIVQNTPNTFVSVGGANAPYPWDYETVAQGVSDIEGLVDYYHFIGVDFDVEGAALETPATQKWVAAAVAQLRKDRPNLVLTLTVPDPVIGFTTGTVAILNNTLQANNNKMVFDWVNKMDFDENGLGNGCTQTNTNMNNNCLVISATTGAQQLATMLGISTQDAYQYLGETFMVPSDDQGHPLSLALATQVATTLNSAGVIHMGYWRIQNDDKNFTYGNNFTHILGLS